MSFSHPIRNNVVFFDIDQRQWVNTLEFSYWASISLEGNYQI
jgi:hypothetical protein